MRLYSSASAIDVTDRLARDLGFVRDFWFRSIRNSQAFSLAAQVTAGAGLFEHIQLFNPVGSTITVVIRRVVVTVGTTQIVTINTDNAARANLFSQGINLISGAAAGQAALRHEAVAAVQGTQFKLIITAANTPFVLASGWDIQLTAGQGATVVAQTVATQLAVTFEWVEL